MTTNDRLNSAELADRCRRCGKEPRTENQYCRNCQPENKPRAAVPSELRPRVELVQ